jgi:hypothetical protein
MSKIRRKRFQRFRSGSKKICPSGIAEFFTSGDDRTLVYAKAWD